MPTSVLRFLFSKHETEPPRELLWHYTGSEVFLFWHEVKRWEYANRSLRFHAKVEILSQMAALTVQIGGRKLVGEYTLFRLLSPISFRGA